MRLDEDEKLAFDALDSLDPENIEAELQGIDYTPCNSISEDSLKRIKDVTYGNIGIKKSKPPRRWIGIKVAAAILAISIAGTGFLGYGKVWAAIKKTIGYIPGTGVTLDKHETSKRYILLSPVKKDVDGKLIVLKTVIAESGSVAVYLGGTTPKGPVKNAVLVDGKGNQYESTSLGWGGGLKENSNSSEYNWWSSAFKFNTSLDNYSNLQIKFDDADNQVISFSLQKAEASKNYLELGPTISKSGIEISTITSKEDGILKINYITKSDPKNSIYNDFYAAGFPIFVSDATLKDMDGKIYNRALGRSVENGLPDHNGLYFDLKGSTKKDFTLTVPSVYVDCAQSQTISFDIPHKGDLNINKTISMSGYPVEIKTIKRISDKYIALLFDTHYTEKDSDYLGSFSVYHAKDYGINIACAIGADEPSFDEALQQVLKYKDPVDYYLSDNRYPGKMIMKAAFLPIKPDMKSVDLIFDSPRVSKPGPWVFDIKIK